MDKWTNEDRKALLAFKNNVDSDNIKIKEQIKQNLLDNRFIIHVLNNLELEESDAEPSDYYGVNILPYYMIHDTQTDVKNYICFEVGYKDLSRDNNKSVKLLRIIFYILCQEKNGIDEETGIARHDLLAALIQDQFNFTNYFGRKIELISDEPSIVDTNYFCRTMVFGQTTDNNLVKTHNTSRLANKDIVF